MTSSEVLERLIANIPLLVIALAGGFILFCYEVFQIVHYDKLHIQKLRYRLLVGAFLCIGLPVLGAVVAAVYITNGDQISPLLAFQIGLSSPAIATSLMTTAANTLAKGQIPTAPGQ